MSMDQQRQKTLVSLGLRRPKRKYSCPEERKEAAAKRARDRREQERMALEPFGLAPKKRVRKSVAQKKAARRTRSAKHREFMRWAINKHPDKAQEFGIDVKRVESWSQRRQGLL